MGLYLSSKYNYGEEQLLHLPNKHPNADGWLLDKRVMHSNYLSAHMVMNLLFQISDMFLQTASPCVAESMRMNVCVRGLARFMVK